MQPCPHCQELVPIPPINWHPPWQCSYCSGLYGQGRGRLFRIPIGFEPLQYLMEWSHAHHWCHYSENNHYVYALCYPTGLPFYVGKGSGNRMLAHAAFIGKREPRDEKELVIANLQDQGVNERYAVLSLQDDQDRAYQHEAMAILLWGRRSNGGLLTNADEGDTRGEPENWELPTPPIVQVRGNPNPMRWVIHPAIQFRCPTHRGMLIICPQCREQCIHPSAMKLEGIRCPFCHHFWRVDIEKLYDYWARNRHDHSRPLKLPD